MGHFLVAKCATREGSQISSRRDAHHRFGLACFWLVTRDTPATEDVIPISRPRGNVGSGLREGVVQTWSCPKKKQSYLIDRRLGMMVDHVCNEF